MVLFLMWMVSVPCNFLSETMREVEEEEGPTSSCIFSTLSAGSRQPESASEMAVSVSESRSRYLGLFLELFDKLEDIFGSWKKERHANWERVRRWKGWLRSFLSKARKKTDGVHFCNFGSKLRSTFLPLKLLILERSSKFQIYYEEGGLWYRIVKNIVLTWIYIAQ